MGVLVNLARNYKIKCECHPMKSSSHRKWIAKNLLAAKPKSARIHVEELEGRWVPASVPPGNYSGNINQNTEFDQAGTYTINGNLTVSAGKTLTIGVTAGVNVVVNRDVIVTVAGTLNVSNPSSFAIVDSQTNINFGVTSGVQVSSGGSFSASNATFSRVGGANGLDSTRVKVDTGGNFAAKDSTFAWDQVVLSNNSTVNPGDITNDAFDGTLFVQAKYVPLLDTGNNKRFRDISFNAGSTTDATLTLAPIGTDISNQRYTFLSDFLVASGTIVNVAANSKVVINRLVNLTVAGALNVESPSLFAVVEGRNNVNSGGTTGIQVSSGGSIAISNATLSRVNNTNDLDTTRVLVDSGGRFSAKDSKFEWDRVALSNDITLNPDGITNNAFDGTLAVQAKLVSILDVGNNKRFQDVNINGGSTTDVTLTLKPLGVDTTNQQFVFPANFTVAAGTTLDVLADSKVVIDRSNITVVGALTVTKPTLFAIVDSQNNVNFGVTSGVQINSGGSFSATKTIFSRLNGANSVDNTRILVNTGGQLIARGSSFNIDQVVLGNGSRADAQFNFFNTSFLVNSGTVISNNAVRNNDFSPVAVVASGATGSTIDLTNNYWGSTVNAVIDALITDQKDTAALPLVNYLAVLPNRPVNTQAATPAPIDFAPATATSIPLSATLTSPTSSGPANVTSGTITFRLLQGVTLFGTAVTVNVVGGVANATYILPAGTAAGTYIVEATYNGSGSFGVSIDNTQTLIVNPIAQTITFNAPAPVTFGVTSINLTANSDSGLAIIYSIVSGPGTVSGNTVTITGAGSIILLATQPGNGNFLVAASVQRTFVVNKAAQTITFNAPAPTAFANNLTINLSGISTVPGLPVSFVVVSGPGTISGTTLSVTGVGSIVVRATQSGNINYLAASNIDRTFVINQASQTITFTAPAPVTFAPGLTVNLSASAGSSLGVIFSVVSGPGTLAGNVLTISGAGSVVVQANQPGNANFTAATAVQQTVIVNLGSQTITFTTPAPSTFAPGLTVNLNATGGVSGNAVIYSVVSGPGTVSGSVLTITSAGNIVVNANQTGNANFNAATLVQSTVTVNKAVQTIVFATPQPVTFALGLTIDLIATGGITGNPVSFTLVSGPGTLSGTVLTVTGAGDIVVRADQAGNGNYLDATISRTFAITPLSQTIAFAALPPVGFASGITVDLNATGGASGNAVTFRVVSGPGAISNNILTVTGAGDIVVQADQAGGGNFSAAVAVNQTLTVNKATQTIAFAAPVGTLPFGTAPQTLTGNSNSTLAVTFTVISGPGTIVGNTLTITGAGLIVVEASQAGDANFTPAVSVQQTFTIDKLAQTIAFAPLSPVSFTFGRTVPLIASGGASGVAVLFNVVSGPGTVSGNVLTITGSGEIVVRADQAGDANYTAATSVLQNLSVTRPTESLVGVSQFAVGSDAGGSNVTLFNADKSVRFSVTAFPGFTGGVRTVSADFNGDGVADLIIGTGPGRATQVRILDGKSLAELFSVDPFEASFTGGVYVSAGDVTGDGIPDLAITPDEGGGPRVDIYSGAVGFPKLTAFFGIDDTSFRGGARSAIADMTGDGVADLIVVAGFGGGPRVAAFDGKSLTGTPVKIFGDFFAFEQALRNGIFVTAGDINGDGFADLIAGGGPGGGPRVLAFDGKSLLTNEYVNLANFFGGDVNSRGGIRVAVKNLDGDTKADLVVGSGAGAGSRVTGYLGANIAASGTPTTQFDFDSISGFTGGVFVG